MFEKLRSQQMSRFLSRGARWRNWICDVFFKSQFKWCFGIQTTADFFPPIYDIPVVKKVRPGKISALAGDIKKMNYSRGDFQS